MSERGPDIHDILDELDPADRERLRTVHELLVQAGPPPELSPGLAAPRPPRESVIPFPRYRSTVLAAAAAAAVILFGIGYGIGRSGNDKPDFTVTMTGAGGAHAALAVFAADDAGNWPMKLQVRGLRSLPTTKRYELWLTRRGELVQLCGTFSVTRGETEVPLNAPYRLRTFDGWVVVVEGTDRPVLRTAQV